MVNGRALSAAGIVIVAVLGFLVFMTYQTIEDRAAAQPAFDYSQCQYPDRTTNPPGGCDNSDPCDPANVKGGSGDCVDVAVPKVNETAPTVDVEPTPAPVTNTCGGK